MQKTGRGTSIMVMEILSLASASYIAGYLLMITWFSPIAEPFESLLGYLLLLSIPGAMILGPAAWIMGTAALRGIRAGVRDPSGKPRAKAGLICGMLTTILLIGGGLIAAAGLLLVLMVRPGR
jgi:hypothetical protein